MTAPSAEVPSRDPHRPPFPAPRSARHGPERRPGPRRLWRPDDAIGLGSGNCIGLADSAEPSASAAASSGPIGSAFAGAWVDATARAIRRDRGVHQPRRAGRPGRGGDVDILFANGGGYEAPEEPEASRVFLNTGDGTFEEATEAVMGRLTGTARVIKVADLDGDGGNDILLGTTYETQSQLLLSSDNATWTDGTADHLPAVRAERRRPRARRRRRRWRPRRHARRLGQRRSPFEGPASRSSG